MSILTDELHTHAEIHAQYLERELRPWSEYLCQYQGRMTGSTRCVYIKALCRTPADINLQKAFYEAANGGSCFFGATYDVTRGRFDSFQIKAE